MNLAREINKRLDAILQHNAELKELNKEFKNPEFQLKDAETGEVVTKEFALNKAEEAYDALIGDLNQITNEGKNCRDLFTNIYYVNNLMEDKVIASETKKKEDEIKDEGDTSSPLNEFRKSTHFAWEESGDWIRYKKTAEDDWVWEHKHLTREQIKEWIKKRKESRERQEDDEGD